MSSAASTVTVCSTSQSDDVNVREDGLTDTSVLEGTDGVTVTEPAGSAASTTVYVLESPSSTVSAAGSMPTPRAGSTRTVNCCSAAVFEPPTSVAVTVTVVDPDDTGVKRSDDPETRTPATSGFADVAA